MRIAYPPTTIKNRIPKPENNWSKRFNPRLMSSKLDHSSSNICLSVNYDQTKKNQNGRLSASEIKELLNYFSMEVLTSERFKKCVESPSSKSEKASSLEEKPEYCVFYLSNKDHRKNSRFQYPPAKKISNEYDLDLFDSYSFYLLSTSDKPQSLTIQRSITWTEDEEIIERIGSLVQPYLQHYLFHFLGTHLVQSLVKRHPLTLAALISLVKSEFDRFSCDEFASRTLQVVVQMDQDFRDFCLKKYYEASKESKLYKSIPSILLATSVIRAHKYQRNICFFLQKAQKDPAFMDNYRFKRLLVIFTECSPHEELDRVYNLCRFDQRGLKFLNDKYLVFILVGLIARSHGPSVNLFWNLFKAPSRPLFKTNYIGLLLAKIIRQSPQSCLEGLFKALQNPGVMPVPTSKDIISIENFYFFSFSLLLTASRLPKDVLDLFLTDQRYTYFWMAWWKSFLLSQVSTNLSSSISNTFSFSLSKRNLHFTALPRQDSNLRQTNRFKPKSRQS